MLDGSSKVLTINDTDSLNNDAGVTSVAISPNNQYVAAGSLDTVVRIWDVATGQLVERLRGHRDSVYSVAFTPDGQGLISGSLDKTLKYWDIGALLRSRKENPRGPSGNGPIGPGTSGRSDIDQSTLHSTRDFVGHKVRLDHNVHNHVAQYSLRTMCSLWLFRTMGSGSYPVPKTVASSFGIRRMPLCNVCCRVTKTLVRSRRIGGLDLND